jgi:HlyD family secretion protein
MILGGLAALIPRLLKKQPIAVEVVRVERTTVRDEVSSASAGEVLPEMHATVRTELSAQVTAVRHRRGERVKKDEVIVALNAGDLNAKLSQAQANLAVQRAQADQTAAHAESAVRTAERTRRLAEKGAETAQLAEDTAATVQETLAAARAAQEQVAQTSASLRAARISRWKAELRAPFSGLLVEVYVDPGDTLQAGASVFELIDDSKLHVETMIDEADLGRIRIGQPATLRLDALPNQKLAGEVTKLSSWVRKDEKGARTLRIEIDVLDLKNAMLAGLRAGMSVNVDIRVAEKQNVLSLPSNVIIGRGMQRSVYRVENGMLRTCEVATGLSSFERTELLSGLADGDLVIATLNLKGLADGVPVTLTGTH